ncbi:MAG: glycosyltransferase family 1 protein [Phycisphaerae bacterium]
MIKLVINSVPTAPGGGLTNLLGLLEGWRRTDADVNVTVMASRPETLDALNAGGWSENLHAVPMMGLARRMIWERAELPNLLRQLRADLVLSNNFMLPSAPCPQVVHHQNLFTCFSPGFLPYARLGPKFLMMNVAARHALKHAAANVFISHHVREHAERMVPCSAPRNHVVYYGLSETYSRVAREVVRRSRSTRRLMAMQFPEGYKDNESLLSAFATLVQQQPDHDWQLDIAGWGNWDACKQRAAQLGIASRVNFLGFVNGKQVVGLLRAADCLIYPSVFEGFGLPVIEAQAAGCPVVAVRGTAIPEIAGNAAMLVSPRSPSEIAKSVMRLYSEPGLRERLVEMGQRNARQFAWTRSAQQFCRVFENVLHEPVPTRTVLEPEVAGAQPALAA